MNLHEFTIHLDQAYVTYILQMSDIVSAFVDKLQAEPFIQCEPNKVCINVIYVCMQTMCTHSCTKVHRHCNNYCFSEYVCIHVYKLWLLVS